MQTSNFCAHNCHSYDYLETFWQTEIERTWDLWILVDKYTVCIKVNSVNLCNTLTGVTVCAGLPIWRKNSLLANIQPCPLLDDASQLFYIQGFFLHLSIYSGLPAVCTWISCNLGSSREKSQLLYMCHRWSTMFRCQRFCYRFTIVALMASQLIYFCSWLAPSFSMSCKENWLYICDF